MDAPITRRRLLRQGMALASGAAVLAAWPKLAVAWSLEPMDAATSRLAASRCGGDGIHETLLRDLQDRLDGRPLTDDEKALVRAQLSTDCPLCGCRLSLADATGKPPGF